MAPNKSRIHQNKLTDRREFGGKPSKWRWRQVLLWKIPEFCSVGGVRSKNSIFRVFRYPSTVLRTAYRKQFYPKPMVPMENLDSEGVPFASLESLWPGIWQYRPWRVRKSGHVTITKIENLHIGTCRKIHWFQIRYSFRSTTKNNEVIAENPFQNSGVTRRLWTLGHLELTLAVNTGILPSSFK